MLTVAQLISMRIPQCTSISRERDGKREREKDRENEIEREVRANE